MLKKEIKTRLFVLIACIAVGAGILSGCLKEKDPVEEDSPARGSGTASDPYIIITAQQLSDLRNYVGKEYAKTYFKLGKDIDISSFSEKTWGSKGWKPIGTYSYNNETGEYGET
ncbi:MAG: hypothetical protein LBT50_04965, partial [Prevotellaceae bacterium]|nr:hypothetical protein [Prevotellaceae bacterium]